MNTHALEKLAQTAKDSDDIVNRVNEAIRLVVPFIKEHEGYRHNAYWDKYGKKYTLGHGHTFIPDANTRKLRAVTKNDTMDEAASSSLVIDRLRRNAAFMYRKLPWTHSLSPGALAAIYDIAYNAGPGVFSAANSPRLTRMMNAPGADRDAIVFSEVPTYRKAGGKVVKGVLNRRMDSLKAFQSPKVPKIGT